MSICLLTGRSISDFVSSFIIWYVELELLLHCSSKRVHFVGSPETVKVVCSSVVRLCYVREREIYFGKYKFSHQVQHCRWRRFKRLSTLIKIQWKRTQWWLVPPNPSLQREAQQDIFKPEKLLFGKSHSLVSFVLTGREKAHLIF